MVLRSVGEDGPGREGCLVRSGYDFSRSFDPIPRDGEEHGEFERTCTDQPGLFSWTFRTADWRLGKGVEGADAWWQSNKRMRCRQLPASFLLFAASVLSMFHQSIPICHNV